jgi:hypothetical protein
MVGDSFRFVHRGYSYSNWKDYEDDNVKIFHEVYDDDKYVCSFPYSPYGVPTQGLFARWIDAGMPSRELMGGHFREDHDNYYNKWLNNQIDKMLVEEMTDAL